jgi:hypothetical protein
MDMNSRTVWCLQPAHRVAARRSARSRIPTSSRAADSAPAPGRATLAAAVLAVGLPEAPALAQGLGCSITAPSTNIQAASAADTRCLGVAVAVLPNGAMKWFVSRSANGGVIGTAGAPNQDQRISVFDADPVGNILTGTRRDRLHHPNMTSLDWGHRDGEGYTFLDTTTVTYRSVTFWGDEARNLFWMDAVAETWSGQAFLSTFGGANASTIRAIGARPTNSGGADQAVLVYVCDFTNPIEEWIVDLATGTYARTATPAIQNPGDTYGLTCFERNGLWYLAAHHQRPNTCPGVGVGLCHLTIIDLQTYAVVWERDANDALVGVQPNPAGGFAGGLQHVVFHGQPTLACLQQAFDDWISYVPYGGFGVMGPRDCGTEYLTLDGIASAPFFTGVRVHGANPNKLYLCAVGFPPAQSIVLPFNPACRLALPIPVPAVFLMPTPAGNSTSISFRVPNGYVGEFLFDAGAIDLATNVITSTNWLEMRVRLSPF